MAAPEFPSGTCLAMSLNTTAEASDGSLASKAGHQAADGSQKAAWQVDSGQGWLDRSKGAGCCEQSSWQGRRPAQRKGCPRRRGWKR